MLTITPRDIQVGAVTLLGEAANQGVEGEIAVAWVVRNRCRDNRWPNTPAEVCLQRAQFSCWLAADWNTLNLLRMLTDFVNKSAEYLQAEAVAHWVLGGFTSYDPTNGANHYHTRGVTPAWSDSTKVVYEHRQHIFYKL